VLAVVKKQQQPISKVCHRFDPLPQALRNVRYKGGRLLESVKVRNAIKDGEARLAGHGRLVVRPSGTEPMIRVMGEGDDKVLVKSLRASSMSSPKPPGLTRCPSCSHPQTR
jgi:phosphoglucosamine mutase